jgi:catechol 2,3-dioxygenase-like lactoylglutathione lyase family enzyme
MTAQRGYVGANVRSGALGVHSLDHFSMTVPDLAVAQAYFADFGLDVREDANALQLRTYGSDHVWGVVVEGPSKRLRHISFACFAEDLQPLKNRVEQNGIRLLDAEVGFDSNGIFFRDHNDLLLEIKVAPKSTADTKMSGTWRSSPGGVAGAPNRAKAPIVRPRRMSHMLSFTADIEKAIAFYSANLGLRLSDRTSMVGFLHGIHGSDHHILAFAQSSGPGLHHSSWDLSTIDDIGLAALHMADKGHVRGWGLGRHVLGSNYFHYVQDPWGSFTEYTCDIDYIARGQHWETGHHADEDSFYLWGPTPPEDFVTNHEAA